jgi:hypothetical protein
LPIAHSTLPIDKQKVIAFLCLSIGNVEWAMGNGQSVKPPGRTQLQTDIRHQEKKVARDP